MEKEVHNGIDYYSRYFDSDAKALAAELASELGGRIEPCNVNCDRCPIPDGLDTWSGEIQAYAVDDVDGYTKAIVGWWDIK